MNSNKPLYSTVQGTGQETVVFLHGLWGGGNYFRGFKFFDTQKYTQYFPDELGFGESPKPHIDYTLENHCESLYELLLHKKPFILVGNSYGTSLAIQFAKQYPHMVKKLILISPVIHVNAIEAKKYLSHRFIPWLTIRQPMLAHMICKIFCDTGLLEIISPFYFRSHKVKFLKGCTHHTWHSYYSTFTNGFLKEVITPNTLNLIANSIPTLILSGTVDSYVDTKIIKKLSGKKLTSIEIDGTHNLMFEKFDIVKTYIKNWLKN